MRRAFTIVELLVVIAVIAILVALLIPAVQSAREAARKAQCANHLKQIALAVANYTAAHNDRLPPRVMTFFGRTGRRPLSKGKWECGSWAYEQSPCWRVAVLPFLEEQNLYDMFDLSQGVITEPNFPAISHVLPVFQCPSTPGYPRTTLQTKVKDPNRKADWYDFAVGAWDYGAPGRQWDQGRYENRDHMFFVPAWHGSKDPGGHHSDYACRDEPDFGGQAKLVWITDGLSNTTVVHEIAWVPNFYDIEGLDGYYSDSGERMSGKSWPQIHGHGWTQLDYYADSPLTSTPINENNHSSRFSFHPGGVNNAFLDGSVRFLDESTDVLVLRDITSRAGEERVGYTRQ